MTAPTRLERKIKRCFTVADQCANSNQFAKSLEIYKKGIILMGHYYHGIPSNIERRLYIIKINWYIERAKAVLNALSKQQPLAMKKLIHIKEGDTKKGYDVIFGPYLDCLVKAVKVYEPHLRNLYQINNFKHLLKEILLRCENINEIHVETSPNLMGNSRQREEFVKIKDCLPMVRFHVNFSDTCSERAVLIDSGWMIKIGKGLNYFYKIPSWFPTRYNLNLVGCHETFVSITYNAILQGGIENFHKALEGNLSDTPEAFLYNVYMMESGLDEPGMVPDGLTSAQRGTVASVFRNFIAGTSSKTVKASVAKSPEGMPVIRVEKRGQANNPVVKEELTGTPIVQNEPSENLTNKAESLVIKNEETETPVVNPEETATQIVNTEETESPMAISEETDATMYVTEETETPIVNTEETENGRSGNVNRSTRRTRNGKNAKNASKFSTIMTRSKDRHLRKRVNKN